MRFDILGRRISARVTSIRDVEWRESRNGGFVFVFRPGRSTRRRRRSSRRSRARRPSPRARVPARPGRAFPNVSVIDFREMLETLRDVMSKVHARDHGGGRAGAVQRRLILIGAVAMTKFQRVYEAAVFKTLGANTRTIARMLLFEYGVLGSLAGSDRLARGRSC
jgi:putative ABC transport system permease protein